MNPTLSSEVQSLSSLSYKRLSRKLFAGLIFLFLLTRFLLLLTNVESFSVDEELYRGTIAKEFMRGLRLPWWDYQEDAHAVGSVVEGALAVPFFKLFGPSLFALKMVPLSFSLLTFVLMILFLEEFFDPAAAAAGGLLMIFAPPAFMESSFGGLGNHGEVLLFDILSLFFFYRYQFRRPQSVRALLFSGFFAGFGTAFCSSAGLIVIATLFSWFALRRRSFLSGHFFLYFLPFLIGVSLCLPHNLTHDFAGFHFIIQFFQHQESWRDRLVNFVHFFLTAIPASSGFHTAFHVPWFVFAGTYWAALLAVLLPAAKVRPDSEKWIKCLPLVIYLGTFMIVSLAASRPLEGDVHLIHFRYWIPFYFILFLLIAAGSSRSRFGILLIGLLLLFGAFGQLTLPSRESFGRIFSYTGYSYYQLPGIFLNQSPGKRINLSKLRHMADGLSERDERLFFMGVAALPELMAPQGTADQRKIMELFPFARYPFLYETFRYLQGITSKNGKPAFSYALVPEQYRNHYERGWLQIPFCPPAPDSSGESFRDDRDAEDWYAFLLGSYQAYDFCPGLQGRESALRPNGKHWFYRGAGSVLVREPAYSEDLKKEILLRLQDLPEQYHADLLWGAGWRAAALHPEDPLRAKDILSHLPAGLGEKSLSGLEAYYQAYDIRIDINIGQG